MFYFRYEPLIAVAMIASLFVAQFSHVPHVHAGSSAEDKFEHDSRAPRTQSSAGRTPASAAVHGGSTLVGNSTLVGSVVARVATSLTTKADDLQHFTGVQIGLVSDLYNSSQYTPFFPSANQQFVPR